MPGPYDDILHLSRPKSGKHPPMPMANRAAQFLPFSALTGLETVIAEEARQTEAPRSLGEDALMELDEALLELQSRLSEQPEVTITHFVPDEKKAGGRYETVAGRVRRLDAVARTLILTDGTAIELDKILSLELLS